MTLQRIVVYGSFDAALSGTFADIRARISMAASDQVERHPYLGQTGGCKAIFGRAVHIVHEFMTQALEARNLRFSSCYKLLNLPKVVLGTAALFEDPSPSHATS